ncbi:Uncharacterised protein g2729 [Pycnogonum litorale]
MEKVIRPEKFDVSSDDPDAAKHWKLWYRGFKYFLSTIASHNPNKLEVLFLHIGPNVFDLVEDATSFDEAISALESAYVKAPSEVHSRYLLSTRNQSSSESIDTFLQALNKLAVDCKFKAVSAEKNKDDFVRDSFISGLRSNAIRTRLLENDTLDLKNAVQQARALEQAQKHAECYQSPNLSHAQACATGTQDREYYIVEKNMQITKADDDCHSVVEGVSANITSQRRKGLKCFNCGGKRHLNDNKSLCPARDAVCRVCGKIGHYAKVCRSKTSVSCSILLASVSSASKLTSSVVRVFLNDAEVEALIDTGSSENFISQRTVKLLKLQTLFNSS